MNKLRLNSVRNLHAAFSLLDGFTKIVKDEKVTEPYQFSGKVRWNIAKNLRVLNVHVTDFNSARDALIKQITHGENEIDSSNKEQMSEYIKGISEIDSQEVDVNGLLVLKVEDLDLDKNPIPSTILSALGEYVTD